MMLLDVMMGEIIIASLFTFYWLIQYLEFIKDNDSQKKE